MRLNNTFAALNNSIVNQKETTKSLNKLSSGLRINKASDDASGLAIADKLRTHASGIKQGIANANSAIAMMNIADKGMSELSNILDIIKSKAIQMSTATTSEEGKKNIKTEILKLIDNYDSIVNNTKYNTRPLLKGCEDITFHLGNELTDTLTADIKSVQSCDVGKPDPYKLNNFISGFTQSISDLSDIISSDIPGFEDFDWSSATRDANGNYVIDDFNLNINGKQRMNLSNATTNLLNIKSGTIKDVEFTFNNFDFNTERFTIKDSNTSSEIAKLKLDTITAGGNDISFTDNRTGYIIEDVPLDTSYVNSLNYEETVNGNDYFLISNELGSIKLNDIKKDISIEATGAFLELDKIVISLQDNNLVLPINDNCGCNNDQINRNDTNPNLTIQAQELMSVIDEALSQLNLERGEVGSITNQLEASTRNLMTNYVNTKNAESIIRDVDYAQESANFSKLNVIEQSGSFAHTKQNETQQRVLELLK